MLLSQVQGKEEEASVQPHPGPQPWSRRGKEATSLGHREKWGRDRVAVLGYSCGGGRARPRLSLDTYNREGNSGEPGVGGAVASRRLSPPNQRQQLLPLSLTSPGLRFASSCQVLGAARNPDVSMDAPNRFNINRLFFKIEHTWEPNGVPSGHSWPTGRPLATPARALTAIILWRVTSPGYSRGHGGPARSGGSPQGPHGRSNPRGTGLASGIQTSGLG